VLAHEELQELGLLYRQAATDLATLRQDAASAAFAEALNQLLARAHHTIYAAERRRPLAAATAFVREYPGIVRRSVPFWLAAAIIFTIGGLCGAAMTYRDPELKLLILGPGMVDTINRHEMWTHSIVGVKPIASSAIMTNNITVSLMAFAMGITAGLGTLYMMAFNGFLMGVIAVACWLAGMSLPLWSFVAPHGALEIPAIILAGGAGLRLAHGVLFPGSMPRRASISRAGLEAVQLALGCVPMLVVAGIVEAFVSPTDLAVSMKFAISAALFSLLVVYVWWPSSRQSG
jgi:uncharacterized membrane protein SpoIIM required for sporulation